MSPFAIEGDVALEGALQAGGLDGITDVGAVDRLVGLDRPVDRVRDDEHAVVRGDRVVGRLPLELRLVGVDPLGRLLVAQHVRRGVRRPPALGGLLARLLREGEVVDAVGPELVDLRHDLLELPGELHGRLLDAAVVDGVGVQALDLRQDGLVVGFLRVEAVTAEDLDLELLGATLEAVRDPHAEGPAVVQDVDLLDLQVVEGVVGHVRALVGVRRHRPEVDRLALGPILGLELRVRDVRIRRARCDRRQVGLGEDRRRRLALTAHLRPDQGDDRRVGDELPDVRRRLGRIVLAGRRGGAVEDHGLELVAGHAALLVDLVDRQLGALGDGIGRVGVRPGERERHADLGHLLLRQPAARQDHEQSHRQQHRQRSDKSTSHHHVTSRYGHQGSDGYAELPSGPSRSRALPHLPW